MPQTMRVGISPSVLIAVLIPLITDATAKYPFFIDQGITFLKTILIFILILAVISLLIIFPFFKIIFIS